MSGGRGRRHEEEEEEGEELRRRGGGRGEHRVKGSPENSPNPTGEYIALHIIYRVKGLHRCIYINIDIYIDIYNTGEPF